LTFIADHRLFNNQKNEVKMKKVMGILLAVMFMMTGFCVMAQSPFYAAGDITVAAGVTNVVKDDITLYDTSGPCAFRELEEFIVKNVSGTGTGTVTLLSVNIGVETQIMNAGSHIPGYSTISYPRRTAEVQSWAGWVVTGNVAVAKSTVVTNYEKYGVRKLKINIAQPASATANVYRYSIKAK